MKAWFLAFLLLAPAAMAHEDHEATMALPVGTYEDHGTVIEGDLTAGEDRSVQLAFGGTMFWEGWLWAVYGTTNGTLGLAMERGNDTIRSWTWEPGAMRLEVGRFAVEDFYTLRLQNPGNGTVRYALSFDQTCDCSLKTVPYDGGYAWTNVALEKGQTAHFTVHVQPLRVEGNGTAHPTLTAMLLRADGDDPTFAEGLTVLEAWAPTGPFWNASVTAKDAGTYYVLLRADSNSDTGTWRFYVSPTMEVEEAPLGRLPFVFAGLALAVGAAYALGRTKRR